MKRLVLACVATVASPLLLAQSNVTIYGIIDAAVRHATNANANRDSLNTMDDGIMTGSRLGFRGREDLDGRWAAVFTLESGFEPGSGQSLQATPVADFGQVAASPRFWGREIHLALRGPDVGVTLGRQYTVAHSLAARFQSQGNPNSTAHSLFSSHHIARQDNQIRIDGKLGPVELLASRTLGEQAASSSANGAWALGAGYTQGIVSVAAYAQQLDNLAGTERRKIFGAGGNVKVHDRIQLYAGAMRRTNEVSPQVNRAWTLGANLSITPQILLSAQHYRDNQRGSAALDGARTVDWLMATYKFSARTDIYAVVDRNKVTGGYAKPAFMGVKGSQQGYTVALRHRF